MPPVDELLACIDGFIAGIDTSLAAAGRIEAGLDDAFPDHERLHDTVLMLASYRPGGGEFLFDEDAMRAELAKVRALLG